MVVEKKVELYLTHANFLSPEQTRQFALREQEEQNERSKREFFNKIKTRFGDDIPRQKTFKDMHTPFLNLEF